MKALQFRKEDGKEITIFNFHALEKEVPRKFGLMRKCELSLASVNYQKAVSVSLFKSTEIHGTCFDRNLASSLFQ